VKAKDPQGLNQESLVRGVRYLVCRDSDLAAVVEHYGSPPLWARRPGFATLIHIILEQQVSLASARAAFLRLQAAIKPITPRRLLTLNDGQLKRIGFSRQKTNYVRHLSHAIIERRFDPSALPLMPDDEARSKLIELKGIGNWTADIYLLMCLRRPDVWPHGDLALATSAHKVKRLKTRPTYAELDALAEQWRPWRAVAARILWHAYLSERRIK
jgi:DNA-3-methyladenine glycosylase II